MIAILENTILQDSYRMNVVWLRVLLVQLATNQLQQLATNELSILIINKATKQISMAMACILEGF